MGLLLAIILLLLFLVAFVSIFIGFIAPQLYKPLFRKNLGRVKTSLIFFAIFIVSFVSFGEFGDKLITNYPINFSNPQSAKTSPSSTAKPTVVPIMSARQQEDALAKQQADSQANAYKSKVLSMITQFEAEDKILDKHMPTSIYYDYKDDPIYVQMNKAYDDIGCQSPNAECGDNPSYYEEGNQTTEYDSLLGKITSTMSEAMHDLIAPEDNEQKYPRVAEVQIAIKRAERDIEIARKTLYKDASSSDIDAVENDFDADHFGGADTEEVVLDNLTQNLMASDSTSSN